MGFVEAINRLIAIVLDVIRQAGRGRIWLYLLGYFAVSWLVLYAHYDFLNPLFSRVIAAWTGLIDGQRATGFTHYEGHFILLPYFFEWARLILSIVLEGLVFGAAALLFYERFVEVDEDERYRPRALVRRWVHLSLGFLVINGAIFLVSWLVPDLLRPVLEWSPRRQMVLRWLGLPAIYAVVVGAFFYVVPAVAVYRETIIGGIGRSLRLFWRNPGTSIGMAVIVLAVPLLLSNIVNSPEAIVERFKPELMYYLLLLGLLVDVVVGFLWVGMAVRLMVDQED